MSSFSNPVAEYSKTFTSQSAFAVTIIFLSICVGGLFGVQLDYFLEIKCAVRGTCYGDQDLVHHISPIHPGVVKLFLSSLALMGISSLVKSGLFFKLFKSADLLTDSASKGLKNLGKNLFVLGGIFVLMSFPLMTFSWLV